MRVLLLLALSVLLALATLTSGVSATCLAPYYGTTSCTQCPNLETEAVTPVNYADFNSTGMPSPYTCCTGGIVEATGLGSMSAISVGLWVWQASTSFNMDRVFVHQDWIYDIRYTSAGYYQVSLDSGSGATAVVSVAASSSTFGNRWVYHLVTYDGSNVKYYLDGSTYTGSFSGTLNPHPWVFNMMIGALNNAGALLYSHFGRIGRVQIWSAALSSTDAANAPYVNGVSSNRVRYYKLDGDTTDSAGSGYSGTLSIGGYSDTYHIGGAHLQKNCAWCSPGQYETYDGNLAPVCLSCPAGSQCGTNPNQAPTQCVPGTYSTGGAQTCTDCGTDTYAAGFGSTSCTNCAPGTHAPPGSWACT